MKLWRVEEELKEDKIAVCVSVWVCARTVMWEEDRNNHIKIESYLR